MNPKCKVAFACCSYSLTDGASDLNRQSLCTMKAPKEKIEVQWNVIYFDPVTIYSISICNCFCIASASFNSYVLIKYLMNLLT